MVDGVRGPGGLSTGGIDRRRPQGGRTGRSAGPDFGALLEREMRSPVKLSAHAEARLRSSRITLSQEDLAKLEGAVDKAAAKGGRESLVLLGDLALVVSVKNRTVITAVAPERLKENVFTNIDSAVIT